MSRIGNTPIEVPKGVNVDVDGSNFVTVRGPNGDLAQQLSPRMNIDREGDTITVSRPSDERDDRAMHGLTRSDQKGHNSCHRQLENSFSHA